MKNKGQTLVLFILILPIISILILLIINYGILNINKSKLENNIKYAIEYGLNLKLESIKNSLTDTEIENKVRYILTQNIDYDTLDVKVASNNIFVSVSTRNNLLTNILNFDDKLSLSFYGIIKNNKIEIERR